jgi:hypothetical protein
VDPYHGYLLWVEWWREVDGERSSLSRLNITGGHGECSLRPEVMLRFVSFKDLKCTEKAMLLVGKGYGRSTLLFLWISVETSFLLNGDTKPGKSELKQDFFKIKKILQIYPLIACKILLRLLASL